MRRLLALSTAVLLGTLAHCSDPTRTRDGLVVVLWSDGQLGLDFDSVRLSVNGVEVDTKGVTALPTSVGVEAEAGLEVTVEARAIKGGLLRIAAAKRTTIAQGGAGVLDIGLMLDCYDRCVQARPEATLAEFCTPGAPAGATCDEPALVPIESVPAYRTDEDPIAFFAGKAKACASPYCSEEASCADVAGAGAQGKLTCDGSCRAVTGAECDDGLGKGWPTFGGTLTGARRSSRAGPTRPVTLEKAFSLNKPPPNVAMGSLAVVTPDGKFAYAQGSSVFRLGLEDGSIAALPEPSLADIQAVTKRSAACCAVPGAPVLLASGELLALTSSGLLLRWQDPTSSATPKVTDIFKTSTCDNCAGHLAVTPSGLMYATTVRGVLAFDPRRGERVWGPIPTLGTRPGPIVIGGDGRVYVGRAPEGGIEIFTPDGRSSRKEGPDGVFGAVAGVAIGLDGTAYFGTTNYTLHGINDQGSWRVTLDGPINAPVALGADGTLYALTSFPNPAVHAVDRLGRRKWSVALRGGADDAWMSPIVSGDGNVFVANSGGFLLGLAPNGTPLWEQGTGESFAGSLVILPDRKLLVRHGGRFEIFAEAP